MTTIMMIMSPDGKTAKSELKKVQKSGKTAKAPERRADVRNNCPAGKKLFDDEEEAMPREEDRRQPRHAGRQRRDRKPLKTEPVSRENRHPGETGKTDETERGGYGKGSFKESGEWKLRKQLRRQLRPRKRERGLRVYRSGSVKEYNKNAVRGKSNLLTVFFGCSN